jgi:hypothetical protein
VQETDTLGKDSELASTLAQGKPVIAYVPVGDKKYVDEMITNLKEIYGAEKSEKTLLLEQLQIFNSNLIWDHSNAELRGWIDSPDTIDIEKLKVLLYQAVKDKYEERANNLNAKHPLGIQVNLRSGVANGVLVVRNIPDCAKLLEAILLNNMQFYFDQKDGNPVTSDLLLRESITKSIFRVKTGDMVLTNSFWNFYLD